MPGGNIGRRSFRFKWRMNWLGSSRRNFSDRDIEDIGKEVRCDNIDGIALWMAGE